MPSKAAPKKANATPAPKKAVMKSAVTEASVKEFVAKIPNETRRADAEILLSLFKEVTGWEPRMWGPTIIGFGVRHYTYESGRSGEICATGFSPRSTSIVFYPGKPSDRDALLAKLGKYKTSKGCIYVNKLADVDMAVLKKFLKSGLAATKKEWSVTPN